MLHLPANEAICSNLKLKINRDQTRTAGLIVMEE